MIYERKYPLAQLPGEYLLLVWERGYKNIELLYKERELIKLPNNQKLKKGFSFIDSELGKIELKYSEKPISVDIIVDGVHSPVNASHPLKKIKSISNYFWIFASFSLLYLIMQIFIISNQNLIGVIALGIEEGLFITIYIISALFSAKSKPWAVYLGFITYSFVTLIILLVGFGFLGAAFSVSPVAMFIAIIFRGTFIVFMVPYLKMANLITTYKKYEGSNAGLLDDKF